MLTKKYQNIEHIGLVQFSVINTVFLSYVEPSIRRAVSIMLHLVVSILRRIGPTYL